MDYTGTLSPLYTDRYQFNMAQAYFRQGAHNKRASFYYFFRKLPFRGGFAVFCGLADVIEYLKQMRFSEDDLYFLKEIGFDGDFLEYLKGFSFKCDISGVREGEVVFPFEPLITVEGTLIETQLLETLLLNIVNFQSLIATKACRIKMVASDKVLSDFGLRRAQSFASIMSSRAAMVGGFSNTSNLIAAKKYNIPPVGTMAHSFVESFGNELTAFRAYAAAFPENCVLLVDTYNTLHSGLPNAITVAKELQQNGNSLKAIRLDSGDLAYLSKMARKTLDENGFTDTKIIVSNQLDEYVVKSLMEQNAPIDIFGVGTSLITGMPDAALDGVYKLSEVEDRPTLKISDNLQKTTFPGRKKIIRYYDGDDKFYADAVALHDETNLSHMIHPFEKHKSMNLKGIKGDELHVLHLKNGQHLRPDDNMQSASDWLQTRLDQLWPEYKRFDFPHIYKVGISDNLMKLRDKLMLQHTYL